MREFSFTMRESLVAGLRRDYRGSRNTGALVRCQNFKCKKYGLVPYTPVLVPFDVATFSAYGIDLSWPCPQLFRGMGKTLLADTQAIFLVNESEWTLYPLDIYDSQSPSSLANIPIGGPWQLVDLYDTWMLHNGLCTVYHTNRHVMMGETDKVYVHSDTRVAAGCSFKGRAYLGGFDPTKFHTASWSSFWADWASRESHGITLTEEIDGSSITAPIRENMVWWSTIGGGDLLSIFLNDLAMDGLVSTDYSSTKPLLFDYMQRNEAGFMVMPWQGRVRQIIPLGGGVVVYGDGGVTALIPTGSVVGMREIAGVGLANLGAAGGDLKGHVFVDQEGAVWKVNADFNATRLGYTEFFADMLGSDIIVSHNQKENEFTFSNGYLTNILTNDGMSSATQMVTSQVLVGGRMVGIATDQYPSKMEALLTSDVFDLDVRDITSVEWISLGSRPASSMQAAVDFRYDKDEDFSQSDWVDVNSEGTAYIGISALEFRVKLKVDDFTEGEIDYITVGYKASGKRFVRGINVGTAG